MSNYLDLFNDLPLSDSLLVDLSILLLYYCCLFFALTVSILFFSMGGVMAPFSILGFVSMSIIYFLTIMYEVVTNVFLEDIILVLDIIHPVCYKAKVILPESSN